MVNQSTNVGQSFICKSEPSSSTLLIQQPSGSAGSVSGQLFYNALAGRLLCTTTASNFSNSNHTVSSYNLLNDNSTVTAANCGPTIQLSTPDSLNFLFANNGMAQV